MDLIPKIIDIIDKTLEKKEYDPNKIYSSLIKETNLNEKDAKLVTLDVTRSIIAISGNISYITAPMIREITNTILLKHGFEKERLKNTRIGFPYYDLEKLVESNNTLEANIKILEHIKNEFSNVKKLIKLIEKPNI